VGCAGVLMIIPWWLVMPVHKSVETVHNFCVLGLDNAGIVPTVIWLCRGRTVAHPYGVVIIIGLMPTSTTI
jgi:hypothetical protein